MTTDSNNSLPKPIELPTLPTGYVWKIKSEYFGDRRHWSTTLTLHETSTDGVSEKSALAWKRIVNSTMWGQLVPFEVIEAAAEDILALPRVITAFRKSSGEKCTDCVAAEDNPLKIVLERTPQFVPLYQWD